MYVWMSDSHLDFCDGRIKLLGQYIAKDYPDAQGMIITGDVSNGSMIIQHLHELSEGFGKQIYFVTGNHDYYQSSFDEVERRIAAMNNPLITYLDHGNIDLGNDITLVGTSNWYDCRFGNVKTSWIELNDFNFIADFKPNMRNRDQQVDQSQTRAGIQAKKFKERLDQVTTNKIVIAAHVPFFDKSSFHMGQMSDPVWLPWMTSKVSGEVLLDFHEANPEKKIKIIVGHTHSSGIYKIDDNLITYTGKATYNYPKEAGIIDIDNFEIHII